MACISGVADSDGRVRDVSGQLSLPAIEDLELTTSRCNWRTAYLLKARLEGGEAWNRLRAELPNALGRLLRICRMLSAEVARQRPALSRQVQHYFLRRGVEFEVRVYLGEVRDGYGLVLGIWSRLPLLLQLLREIKAVLPLKALPGLGIRRRSCLVLHRIKSAMVSRERPQPQGRGIRRQVLEGKRLLALPLEELALGGRVLAARLQGAKLVLQCVRSLEGVRAQPSPARAVLPLSR